MDCIGLALLLMLLAAAPHAVRAAGDYTEQEWTDVELVLGSADHRMVFTPAHLEFETGRFYRLLIRNPDNVIHEFDSPALFASVYTKHLKAYGADGRMVAEIVGQAFAEIEVAPGGQVAWYFVPVRTAEEAEMICDVPGHLQAGMRGSIRIN